MPAGPRTPPAAGQRRQNPGGEPMSLPRWRNRDQPRASGFDVGFHTRPQIANEGDASDDAGLFRIDQGHRFRADREHRASRSRRQPKRRYRPARHMGDAVRSGLHGEQVRRPDEIRHERIGWSAVDLDRRCRLANPSVGHDHNKVGHRHGFALIVRDDNRGDAEALLQLA